MEIINLNGVEYIKRDTVTKMEKELKELKSTMEQINALSGFKIPTDTTTRHIASKTSESKAHVRINRADTDIFKIPEGSKEIWAIRLMNDDGEFFSMANRKMKVTIKTVLELQKHLSRNLTVKEARDLKKSLGLNDYYFNRLLYNYNKGTFNKFIAQWNKMTQPVVGMKNRPIQNNPEKRKEMGYS